MLEDIVDRWLAADEAGRAEKLKALAKTAGITAIAKVICEDNQAGLASITLEQRKHVH